MDPHPGKRLSCVQRIPADELRVPALDEFLEWINMTEEWRQLDFAPTVEATHDSVRINPPVLLCYLSGCCWVRFRLDKHGGSSLSTSVRVAPAVASAVMPLLPSRGPRASRVGGRAGRVWRLPFRGLVGLPREYGGRQFGTTTARAQLG